ncbi:MAG: hypothetical protein KC609_06120 [Myxococcales bacterium]|nr:hypothetical protein [Myxococcales bacterium]
MRRLVCSLLLVTFTGTLLVRCGARSQFAEPIALEMRCRPVEEYIPTFLQLIDEHKLDNLKSVLSDELTDDLQAELIGVIIAAVKALPRGTLSKVTSDPVLSQPAVGKLAPLLVDILKYFTGELNGTSHYPVVGVVRNLLNNCELNPVLKLLLDLLEDSAFVDTLLDVLADEDVKGIVSSLDFQGKSGREGFVALARNLLVSISQPGFEITDVKVLLGQFIDVSKPPFSTFFTLIEKLIDPTSSLPVLQQLSACMLENDTNQELLGFLFDLLTLPSLDIASVFSEIQQLTDNPDNKFLFDVILDILRYYSVTEDARLALARVLFVILREDVAARLLPDLIVIIESGALRELLTFANLLATKCADPPTPPGGN